MWYCTAARRFLRSMARQTAQFARFCLSLVLVLAAVAAPPASAATLTNPFQSTVAQPGRGEPAREAAFRDALRDVLVRVTGRRDAAEAPALAAVVANAARYVQTFRPAGGGQITVSFDANAIENAVAASGLPFWGAERPAVLVWLAVDRGGTQRGLVSAGSQSEERRTIERAAAQRGLPLVWPVAGQESEALARFDDVFAGRSEPLLAAAARYGANGVLIGKAATGAGGAMVVDWSFTADGSTIESSGQLADGVHLAADRYAASYASITAARLSELTVTVTGVDDLATYAAAIRAVESVSVVRGVAVGEVTAGAVELRVTVRGDAASLRRAMALGGHLAPMEGAGDRLVIQLRP